MFHLELSNHFVCISDIFGAHIFGYELDTFLHAPTHEHKKNYYVSQKSSILKQHCSNNLGGLHISPHGVRQ